jgi:hypothetical protein
MSFTYNEAREILLASNRLSVRAYLKQWEMLERHDKDREEIRKELDEAVSDLIENESELATAVGSLDTQVAVFKEACELEGTYYEHPAFRTMHNTLGRLRSMSARLN